VTVPDGPVPRTRGLGATRGAEAAAAAVVTTSSLQPTTTSAGKSGALPPLDACSMAADGRWTYQRSRRGWMD